METPAHWAPGTSPEETTSRPRGSVVPGGRWCPWNQSSESLTRSGPDLGCVPGPGSNLGAKGLLCWCGADSLATSWTPPALRKESLHILLQWGPRCWFPTLGPSLPSASSRRVRSGAPRRPTAQLRENPPPPECPRDITITTLADLRIGGQREEAAQQAREGGLKVGEGAGGVAGKEGPGSRRGGPGFGCGAHLSHRSLPRLVPR